MTLTITSPFDHDQTKAFMTDQLPNSTLGVIRAVPFSPPSGLESEIAAFEFLQRRAKLISSSEIVPEFFRGQAGVANVVVAFDIADRLGVPLVTVLQNLYVVGSRPAWSSSFLVALVNISGKFGPLQYPYTKLGKVKVKSGEIEDLGCRVETTDRRTGERIVGPMVNLSMAHRDGWVSNRKWESQPETMLMWRAVSFFVRSICPELSLGLPSAEELDTSGNAGPMTLNSEQDFRRPQIRATPSESQSPVIAY
jgi:hypothetical protein